MFTFGRQRRRIKRGRRRQQTRHSPLLGLTYCRRLRRWTARQLDVRPHVMAASAADMLSLFCIRSTSQGNRQKTSHLWRFTAVFLARRRVNLILSWKFGIVVICCVRLFQVAVFNKRPKIAVAWTTSRICLVSEFHVIGPATEKARRP